MSEIAELTLSNSFFFDRTFDAVPTAQLRVEDIHYVQTGEDEIRYVSYVWSAECSLDDFEAAVDDDPSLETWERLTEFDERALYRIETSAHSTSSEPLVFPLTRQQTYAVKRVASDTGVSGWTPHDLRRTVSTWMRELGFSREVVERAIGHWSLSDPYDRAEYRSQLTRAFEAWSHKIEAAAV